MYATVISRSKLAENRVYDGSKRLAGVSLMESPAYDYKCVCIYKYIYTTNTPAGSSALPKIAGGPASVGWIGHANGGRSKLVDGWDDRVNITYRSEHLLLYA